MMVSRSIQSMLVAALLSLGGSIAQASDLIEMLAVTNNILVLHFADGSVRYRGYHQTDRDDEVMQTRLDVNRAAQASSYRISSGDNDRYGPGLVPVRVGRKAKGKGFSRKCLWDGQRCNYDYVLEY